MDSIHCICQQPGGCCQEKIAKDRKSSRKNGLEHFGKESGVDQFMVVTRTWSLPDVSSLFVLPDVLELLEVVPWVRDVTSFEHVVEQGPGVIFSEDFALAVVPPVGEGSLDTVLGVEQ